jgi:hypothetical protein
MNYFLFSHSFRNGTRVVLLLAMLLLNFGYGGTSVAYAAPPAHDNFDLAKTINAIEYHETVNTTEATPSDTAPNVDDPANFQCDGFNHLAGFASVWYTYTPPAVQSLSFDTIGTDYDTYIAVWTGTRGNLDLEACNDETSSGFSELSFVAAAGTTYYIEIAQFNDGLGTTDNIGGSLRFNAYITNTDVRVGNVLRGRYFIPDSGGLRRSFINLNNGPVEIRNVAGDQIIAAERVIYTVRDVSTSFSELMGLPHSQLGTIYWLPWYNNVNLDTQLRIGNVSGAAATVNITIGGVPMGSPIQLAAGASTRVSFENINSGPVRIQSTQNIVAAERVIYTVQGVETSFSEMMALPANQLDNIYWMPWYNNVNLDTQLRIGNVSATPATVRVFIGGAEMSDSPFVLPVGGSARKSYTGINNGPVRIESNVDIVAAERVIYTVQGVETSFSEMMGLPNSLLSARYWMPWYNNINLDTQLRFALP